MGRENGPDTSPARAARMPAILRSKAPQGFAGSSDVQGMKTQQVRNTLVCTLSRQEGSFLGVHLMDGGRDPEQAALWRQLQATAQEIATRRGLLAYEIHAGTRHGGHLISHVEIE